MSVGENLLILSHQLIVSDSDRLRIDNAVSNFKNLLHVYFGQTLKGSFLFGSLARQTLLPLEIDKRAHVDYMVVFFSERLDIVGKYVNMLKDFALSKCSPSEILSTYPQVLLKMGEVIFCLVPAVLNSYGELSIPSPKTNFADWVTTNPKDFQKRLQIIDQNHNNKIIPLIRLVKYWNVIAGYPFHSFFLETKIISDYYSPSGNLWDYFYKAMENITPQWCKDEETIEKIERTHQILSRAKTLSDSGKDDGAIRELQKILPPYRNSDSVE